MYVWSREPPRCILEIHPVTRHQDFQPKGHAPALLATRKRSSFRGATACWIENIKFKKQEKAHSLAMLVDQLGDYMCVRVGGTSESKVYTHI